MTRHLGTCASLSSPLSASQPQSPSMWLSIDTLSVGLPLPATWPFSLCTVNLMCQDRSQGRAVRAKEASVGSPQDRFELLVLKEQTEGRCGWSVVPGEKGLGWSWTGERHRPCWLLRTWKRLLISWEMKKEAVWRILIRAVNLRSVNIPLAAWRGEAGPQWQEGSQLGDLQCSRPEILESLKRNSFFFFFF